MNKTIFYSILFAVFATGCTTTTNNTPIETEETINSYLNQYPTRDRVDYVLKCVAQKGGLTYINQYACGCKIDKIAEKLTFEEFESATTYGFMRKTPGENGGAFRDAKVGKSLRLRLKEAEAYAEKMCFVK